jgi:hypothetical protein
MNIEKVCDILKHAGMTGTAKMASDCLDADEFVRQLAADKERMDVLQAIDAKRRNLYIDTKGFTLVWCPLKGDLRTRIDAARKANT